MTAPEKEYFEVLIDEIGEATIKGGKLPAIPPFCKLLLILTYPIR